MPIAIKRKELDHAQKTFSSFSPSQMSSKTYTTLEPVKIIAERMAMLIYSRFHICKSIRVIRGAEDFDHDVSVRIRVDSNAELSADDMVDLEELVIAAEWGLRDATKESWYFDLEIVEEFNSDVSKDNVISALDATERSTQSSSRV